MCDLGVRTRPFILEVDGVRFNLEQPGVVKEVVDAADPSDPNHDFYFSPKAEE